MKLGEEGDYIPNALPLGQTGSLGWSRSRSCSFESRVGQRLLTRLLTFSISSHLRTSTVRFIFVVFLNKAFFILFFVHNGMLYIPRSVLKFVPQFSSVQDGTYRLGKAMSAAPGLSEVFHNVVFETVPLLIEDVFRIYSHSRCVTVGDSALCVTSSSYDVVLSGNYKQLPYFVDSVPVLV